MIAIDFTTISTVENSPAYAAVVNREFELGVAPDVLEQMETFRDFAALPQAVAFFARASSQILVPRLRKLLTP